MFVTGYDEANRAYLRWYESDPEKSGKQILKFISFFWEDGGKSSHSKPREGSKPIISTKFSAHGFEVSVLTRNSLLSTV